VNSSSKRVNRNVDKVRIWSGSDFPYQCLLDAARTEAFRAVILAAGKPGDMVLDAGSGSGILSFFARWRCHRRLTCPLPR